MTAFAKAYTLKREEGHRKKADILRRASKFATLAGYYRYRDEMDFRALVAAKHPLVKEAYPEFFEQELPTDESFEPETPAEEISALEPHNEGPASALKYIGPLAWDKVLYPNSVLTDEPEPLPVVESTPTRSLANPQETASSLMTSDPEVREFVSDNAFDAGLLPAEEEFGPEVEPLLTLWGQLRPLLLAVVGEKNFEIWLSSVRQGPVFERLIIFEVPNHFFQEYLTEHYAPVVEELLPSLGEHRTFLFQARPEETSLPTAKAPEPEATPKPPTTKWERRLEDLEKARERCTVFDPIYGKHILRIKEHAMLLDVLKLKWAEEDAAPPAPPIKRE